MKSPRVICALLVVSLSIVSAQSFAQYTWKRVATFNTSIGSGYFFDANTGLIGSGVRWDGDPSVPSVPAAIYRTTDGGATWSSCDVPVNMLGAVTQIYMQDAMIGYASIMPSSTGDNYSSLWKTTDGGLTWQDPFHFNHAVTCVYGSGDVIVATMWDQWSGITNPVMGGLYSTDGGQSWTQGLTSNGGNGANGVAFSDSLNGVVSEMNPNSGGGPHWYTTNGGKTWKKTISQDQYESWSVYALANKHIFFTANEGQLGSSSGGGSTLHQQVNWSVDGGATWSRRAYFPHMQFTGTINGMDSTLYVQTDTEVYRGDPAIVEGMYRSDDLGKTWRFVGGPAHSRDTRFVVTGCAGEVVYAFDGEGSVWKTTDGGDGSLHPTTGSVTLNIPQQEFGMPTAPDGQPCAATTVAVPFFTSGCGVGARLDSAWMTGAASFSIDNSRPFPINFASDSLAVKYDRYGRRIQSSTDTGYLHLTYTVNGQAVNKIVTLIGSSPVATASSYALPRRGLALGGFSQPVDLQLKEILPQFALDSLQRSGLATLSMTLGYDPNELSYTFFASPATLATTSIKQPMTGTLNVNSRNSGWSFSPGDFDLGTIRMTVQSHVQQTSLVNLLSLSFVTKNGGVVYPCLATLEDNQWQVVIENTMGVEDHPRSSLHLTPSPFRDHISVSNGDERSITMTLCDVLGRELATFDASAGESQWNTAQLRPGIYVISWQDAGGHLHSIKLTKAE